MNIVALVITAILGVLAMFLGKHLVKVKNIIKEVSELIVVLHHSLEDNKITAEELKKIEKEFKDVIEAIKKK